MYHVLIINWQATYWKSALSHDYRSTIAGSFKNNFKIKKRKNYEIMKTEKQK